MNTGADNANRTAAPTLYTLQYARGGAALAVVMFHAILSFVTGFGTAGAKLPWIGASGVDVFFVISGFVMWTSTQGRTMRVADFYRRRLIRIVPLYWIFTTIVLLLALFAPAMFRSIRLDPSHVAASYMFLPWINPGIQTGTFSDTMVPLLVPGWSLNFEIYFYLIFGLALLAPARWRLVAAVGLILAITGLCWSLRGQSSILRFYASPMILEFIAGILIAHWAATAAPAAAPRRLAGIVLALGSPAVLLVELASRPAAGVVGAILILALVGYERAGTVRRIPLLQLIGDASYSIYLTHVLVIGVVRAVWLRVPFAYTVDPTAIECLFVLSCLLLSTIVGTATHYLLERPLLKLASPTKKTLPVEAILRD
jgi:exopolysaccharide production protein ExoZ